MAALDDAIDALYARPLAEFTPARDALAAQLRKNGARADAARVKALAKPAVSPWTVNQLHHHARTKLAALLEAGAGLREAQRLGSAEDFRAAQARRRDALQALLAEAESRLQQAGHAATPATLQRVGRTLEALAAGGWPEGATAGRLAADLDPPGFDAFAGLPPVGPPVAAKPKAGPADDARSTAKARRDTLGRAEQQLAEAQAALREAKKASAQAAAAADRARKQQQAAQEELQRASQRAREATEEAERASFAARRAATGLSEAERRVEAASAALDRARRAP